MEKARTEVLQSDIKLKLTRSADGSSPVFTFENDSECNVLILTCLLRLCGGWLSCPTTPIREQYHHDKMHDPARIEESSTYHSSCTRRVVRDRSMTGVDTLYPSHNLWIGDVDFHICIGHFWVLSFGFRTWMCGRVVFGEIEVWKKFVFS